MTATQFLGWLLIASPFVGIAVLSSYLMGPLATLGIFTVTGAIIGIIIAGCTLAAS